jgi:ketosteroid isomerase-like protein
VRALVRRYLSDALQPKYREVTMSTRSVLLAALALALASAACQPPAREAGPLSEEDLAAVTGASQAWAEAFGADDDAAAAAFGTENAVLMPPNMPAFQGRQALEEYVATFAVTDFSVARLEIDGRGDLAFAWSTYVVSFVPEGLTEEGSYSGKYLAIWRKQADGSWLIAAQIWNSDEPFPEEGSET